MFGEGIGMYSGWRFYAFLDFFFAGFCEF